jgi:hypothetical protein
MGRFACGGPWQGALGAAETRHHLVFGSAFGAGVPCLSPEADPVKEP